ncbi:hypothetical protein NDN08_008321 [Rhodosorus marinus]|uniref:HEAT repeat domain-containing protein n=1 Tax=Rhodosorus marinus TaxID=101924 RepID=A0AAV8V167_9RHOD|nr:hypothetical protein NDN08_008321 [Rhodosorus marinus]
MVGFVNVFRVGGGGSSVNRSARTCSRTVVRAVALAEVKERLKSENMRDKVQAILALRGSSDQQGVMNIILESGALEDDREQVRVVAHVALGRCGVPSGVPTLLQSMKKDKDMGVRAASAEALTDIEGVSEMEDVLDALIVSWREDPDYIVKHSCIVSMGLIGNERALEVITGILKDESMHDLFVGAAALALRDIAPKGDQYPELLVKSLSRKDPMVRRHIAIALESYPSQTSLQALHKLTRAKGEEIYVRDAARNSLKQVESRMGL